MKGTTQAVGTRKSAVARATVRDGSGRIRVNNKLIENMDNKLSRLKIEEPILLAADIAKKVDIDVRVFGGGVISQAEAVRLAIAKGLTHHTNDEDLRQKFLSYDRTLLVADVRQRESRKPNTRGNARAKRQKSYR